MSLLSGILPSILLTGGLTMPIPPDPQVEPNINLYDSEDLYGDEPDVIALEVSTVRQRLRSLGYHPITSMEFENGRWSIIAYRGDRARHLRVEPNTGWVLSDRPADGR
ncbi:hypothetical protein [Microbulbifer sp. YPW16]|uniref:hypothetical protein n=1 Tax=Microbulbifer sp. YPW16 TaxID=2904242 RepID=UPI001E63AC44|nr:hypothetical protein [Microbulbifer sp. YPW16]UHQ56232.1 hypothetical protein LVE68_04430 [Microbulbifer sp. YPW16]